MLLWFKINNAITTTDNKCNAILLAEKTQTQPKTKEIHLLRLAIRPERSNLLLHTFMVPSPQLRPITQEEENLHPDKQRRQQKRLHQVIQQRRGPPLERAVSDKLGHPRQHVDPAGPVVDVGAVGAQEVVCARGAGDDDRGDQAAGDGFEEDVEDGVDEAADCAEVGWEILILESFGEGEESWGVGGLCR